MKAVYILGFRVLNHMGVLALPCATLILNFIWRPKCKNQNIERETFSSENFIFQIGIYCTFSTVDQNISANAMCLLFLYTGGVLRQNNEAVK